MLGSGISWNCLQSWGEGDFLGRVASLKGHSIPRLELLCCVLLLRLTVEVTEAIGKDLAYVTRISFAGRIL